MTMGTNVISAWDTHSNEYKHNLISYNTAINYTYTMSIFGLPVDRLNHLYTSPNKF